MGKVFRCRGSILLEVVVALALFVFAATVITAGLNSSVHEVERLRLNLHASNLAVSVLSELQMGLKPLVTTPPTPFDPPFEMWNWEVQVTPVDDRLENAAADQRVEVIVRHQSQPIVRRLVQQMAVQPAGLADTTPDPNASSGAPDTTAVGTDQSDQGASAPMPAAGSPRRNAAGGGRGNRRGN